MQTTLTPHPSVPLPLQRQPQAAGCCCLYFPSPTLASLANWAASPSPEGAPAEVTALWPSPTIQSPSSSSWSSEQPLTQLTPSRNQVSPLVPQTSGSPSQCPLPVPPPFSDLSICQSPGPGLTLPIAFCSVHPFSRLLFPTNDLKHNLQVITLPSQPWPFSWAADSSIQQPTQLTHWMVG